MAAAAPAVEVPRPHESTAARIGRMAAKGPLNVILAVLGALWLVPTIGLFLTSILPLSDLASEGWWQIFSHPSRATWSNYDKLLSDSGLIDALKTTAYIAVGNTLLVIVIGALAGGWLFQTFLGQSYGGWIGSTLVAFVGAVVVLLVLRLAMGRRTV